MVLVLRDADRKGVVEIAKEMGELSRRSRATASFKPEQMQGGCFTISSLSAASAAPRSPRIINAPEVAILGVSKSETRPVWNGEVGPRLVLPLSLSYDHRVIDGAAAARFTAYLAQLLGDLRRAMLPWPMAPPADIGDRARDAAARTPRAMADRTCSPCWTTTSPAARLRRDHHPRRRCWPRIDRRWLLAWLSRRALLRYARRPRT